MNQQSSKIKFGFAKVIKKPNLVNQNGQSSDKMNKIEMIEEIEGNSLKILGKNSNDEIEKKLIIPMTNDQKTTPLTKLLEERKKKMKSQVIKSEPLDINDTSAVVKKEPIEETLEQQAARELIEDLQNKIVKSEVKVFEVPINPDELPLEGAKESSLDDYDRVPIGDFGKAMLRGMGWKDQEKKEESLKDLDGPILRPKGMGLGADKVIKKQPLLVAPTQSETLEVKRNACVKILAGKHKNMYGTIEGFDDGGGRVIVKLAIGGLKVTMNEFMVQPIAKQEFAKYGKILNSEKFDEYKTSGAVKTSFVKVETEDQIHQGDRSRERERRQTREKGESYDRPANKSSDRRRNATDEYSSTRKYRGRSRSRSRSRDKRSRRNSSSSDDHKYKKKSSSKHKKHHSSPDSRYSSENEKKHKKKTKRSKKKRDRS